MKKNRNKCKKQVESIWIASIVVFSSIQILFSMTGDVVSGYTPHAPIRIDGNGDFAAVATSGNGNLGTPWIIENYDINGTGVGYCVYIGNTTDYFVVRNCSLHEANGNSEVYLRPAGIALYNIENGTIFNNTVMSSEGSGIVLDSASKNVIVNNSVNSNDGNGISLYFSSSNQISNNTVTNNNGDGIYFSFSNYNTLNNNTLNFDGISFGDEVDIASWNTHTIDTSNMVNGKPVYYWKNQTGGSVPLGAGQVILANCTNVMVENQEVNYIRNGISLGFSSNITTVNNTVSTNTRGFLIYRSINNTISNNSALNNDKGIFLDGYSNNNSISNNMVLNSEVDGIHITGSFFNAIKDNLVSNNGRGIYLGVGYFTTIHSNIIKENDYGILLEDGIHSNITENVLSNNSWGLLIMSAGPGSESNSIHHNNFLNNSDSGRTDNTNMPNYWDNGYPDGGNYWDDYSGYDNNSGPNQDQLGGDGIGDTNYSIAGPCNEVDNYPLMYPVNVENSPPTITTTDETSVLEDELYSVYYSATDPDSDPLIWTFKSNASFLTFNATTTTVSGTSTNDDVGSYWVNIAVRDGWHEGIDCHNFTLTVLNVNDPPEADENISITDAEEDVPYILDISPYISDVDNDSSEISIEVHTAYGTVDDKNITLLYPDGILTDTFFVEVTDGIGSDYIEVDVEIAPVNDAPVLSFIANVTVNEGEQVSITPTAVDVDSTVFSFNYSGEIPGMVMPQNGSVWNWTPSYTQAGEYSIVVNVSDGEHVDNQTVNITVIETGNHAPVFSPAPSAQQINEGEELSVQVTADDLEDDTITYALQDSPAGMAIDTDTGTITWTPAWPQVGTHSVTVTASDGTGTATATFPVTVLNVNDAPVPVVSYYTGIYADGEADMNITVTVRGEKYETLDVSLVEILSTGAYSELENETITRVPGNPNDQSVDISRVLDANKNYALVLEYTSYSLGGTPVTTEFSWGANTVTNHRTFNAMAGEVQELVYDITSVMDNVQDTPRKVRFDASGSWDPDNNIVLYEWDLGDGTTATGMILVHEYASVGTYNVTLTVTDSDEKSANISFAVNLSALAHTGTVQSFASPLTIVNYMIGGDEGTVTAALADDPSGGVVSEEGIGYCIEYTLTAGEMKWANITMPYSESALPDGVQESDLRLYVWDDSTDTWTLVENSGVNTEENYVWGNVTHLSRYTALSNNVLPVSSEPSPWISNISFAILGMIIGMGAMVLILRRDRIFKKKESEK